MIQNMMINMVVVGISAVAAGIAISTYKHYYTKYAELEDMKNIGVQEVVLVSETIEVEE
jgi:Tfp pilus assembly major pilin PilA|tara:strand:+ start:222 stop:398 length:177 start_codon:yes stop_codon:yes gene_type:complete